MSRKRTNRKISEYGKQLAEKQKLRNEYGLREKQFANYYVKASTSGEITGLELLRNLEMRLDNILYRAGFFKSRKQARQAVTHGHILVNDKKVSLPSFQLNLKQKFSLADVKYASAGEQETANWLKVDLKKFSGLVERMPERDEISQDIDEQLVVEYYSR